MVTVSLTIYVCLCFIVLCIDTYSSVENQFRSDLIIYACNKTIVFAHLLFGYVGEQCKLAVVIL